VCGFVCEGWCCYFGSVLGYCLHVFMYVFMHVCLGRGQCCLATPCSGIRVVGCRVEVGKVRCCYCYTHGVAIATHCSSIAYFYVRMMYVSSEGGVAMATPCLGIYFFIVCGGGRGCYHCYAVLNQLSFQCTCAFAVCLYDEGGLWLSFS